MKKYQLLTRADLDGIMSAVLLKKFGIIDKIQFCHPKDMQDGKIKVTDENIITNLPYNKNAHFVFDHHYTEDARAYNYNSNHIIDPIAKSATRVIYRYFGGDDKFPKEWATFLDSVDNADSGNLTKDEILNPTGWLYLNYIVDPRTGIGRYDDKFKLNNFEFMYHIIDIMQKENNIDKILQDPEVKARVNFYKEEQEKFIEQLKKCSTVTNNVVIINYKDLTEPVHVGNRFMIYVLYPNCNISVHKIKSHNGKKTVFAVGKSILNKTNQVNIAELMSEFAGGGHRNAGTCQVYNDEANEVLDKIIRKLNSAE